MSSSPTFSTQKAVRPILLPSNAGPRAASAVRRGSNILGSPSLFHRNHEENFDDDTLTSGGGPFRPVAPLLGVALTGPVEVDAFSHYVREAEALASSSSHSLLGDHHLLAPPRGGDRNEAARAVQAAMLGGKGKGNSSASVIVNGGGMNTGGGGGVQMMTRKPNSNSAAAASSSSVKQQPYPSTASLLSAFRERLSRINSEEEDDVATSDTYEARAFINQHQHQQQRRRASMDNHHPPQPPLPLSSSLSVSSFNQFSKYSSLQALGIDPVLEGLQQQQRDHRRTNSSSPPRLLGGNLPSSSTLNHSNQYLLSVGGGGGAPSSSSPSSYSKLDVDELRRAAKQVSQDALKSVADDVLTGKAFESAEAAVQAAFGDEEQQKEDRFNNIYNSKTNSYGGGGGGGGGDILRSVSPKARRQSIQQQEASKAILDQFIQRSSSHSPQREVFEASALLSSPMPQHHNPPRLSSMPALPQSFNNNNNNSSSSHPNPRQNTASSSRLYQETAASARKKDNLYKDDEKITFRTYKPPHPPSSSTSRPVAMRQRRSSIGSIPVSKLNSNGPPHPHPAQTQHRANAIAKSTTNLNPSSRMGGGVQQQQPIRTRRGSLDSSSLSILAPPKKTLDRLFRNDDPRYSSLYPPTIANSIQRQKEQQLLRQLSNKNDPSSSSQSRAVAHANAQQRTHRIGRPAATAAAAAPVIMRRGDNSNTLLSNPLPEQPPPTLESYEREQVAKWKQAAADVDGPLPPPHLFPLPPGSEGKAVKSLEFLRSLLTTDSYPSNPQAATTSTSRFSPRATTNGGGLKKSKYQTADQAASAAQSAAAAVSASAASAITSTGGILGLLERMALSEEQLSIYRSKSSQLEGILKRLTSQLSHREALEKRLTNNDTSNPTGGFDVNGRRDLLSSLSSSYNTSHHLSPASSALLNASSGGVGGVNIHPSSSVLSSSNHSSSNNADEFTSTYGLTGQMGVGLNADIDHAMSRLYSKLQMELVGDASADITSSSSSSAPPPPPSSSFRVSDANFDLLYPSSSSSSSSSSSASPSSALEKSEEVRGMISKRLEKVHNALTSPNSNIVKRSTDHYMPTGTDGDATSTSLSSPTGANFNSGGGGGGGGSGSGGVLSRLLTGTSLASAIEVAESHSQSMKQRLALAAMTSPPHNQLQQLLANNRQSSSSSFAPSTPPAPPSLFSSVTSAAASTAPSIPSVTTSSLLEQHRQHKEAILSSIKILSNPILIPDASSSSSLPSYLQENTGGTRSSRLALLEGAVANAAKQSQEQQLKSAAARQPSSSLLKTDTLLPKWAISNSNSSSSSSSSSSTLNISVPVKSDVASSSSSSPVKKLSSSDEGGGGGGGGGVLNEAVAVAKAVAEAINKRKNEEKKETSFNDSTLTYASSYSKKPPSTVSASTSSSSSSGAPPLTTTTLKASRVLESFDLLHRMFDDALIPGPDSVSLSLTSFESNNNNTKSDGGGGGEGAEGNSSRTNNSPKSAPPTRDAPLPPTSSSSDTVEMPSREDGSLMMTVRSDASTAAAINRRRSRVSFESLEETASKQFDEKIGSVHSRIMTRLGVIEPQNTLEDHHNDLPSKSSLSSMAPPPPPPSTSRRRSSMVMMEGVSVAAATSASSRRTRQEAANEAFVNRIALGAKGVQTKKVQPFSHLIGSR